MHKKDKQPIYDALQSKVTQTGFFIAFLLLSIGLISSSWNEIAIFTSSSKQLQTWIFISVSFGLTIFLMRKSLLSVKSIFQQFQRFPVFHIFFLSAVLRILWVLLIDSKQVSDFSGYHFDALDILGGEYILKSTKPTGAAIFVALHYWVFGSSTLYPLLSIAFLSAAQVLLVYCAIILTTDNKNLAKISCLLLAIWPEHIMYTNLLGSDVLFGFGILLSVVLYLIYYHKRWKQPWMALALCGLTMSISHWIRPLSPFFMAPIALHIVISKFHMPKTWIKDLGILSFAFIAFIIPIFMWNFSELKILSINPSQMGGWSLLVGTNSSKFGRFNHDDVALLNNTVSKTDNIEQIHPIIFKDRIAGSIGVKRIQNDPLSFLHLILRHKIGNLWGSVAGIGWCFSESKFEAYYPYIYVVANLWHKAAILLVIFSIYHFKHWQQRYDPLFFISILSLTLITALHFFMESQPRYHHIFLPFLCIYLGQWMNIKKFGVDQNRRQNDPAEFNRTKA